MSLKKNLVNISLLVSVAIKVVIFFVFNSTVLSLANASYGSTPTKAIYIVPTESSLVQYSRFVIDIVKPYAGPKTQAIAYVFPEILMGEPNKVIEFVRIPGTINSWSSELAEAHCSAVEDIFSCNVILNKKSYSFLNFIFKNVFAQQVAIPMNLNPDFTPRINPFSKEQSIDHLKKMNIDIKDMVAFEDVIKSFFTNEPAGIFSYEFE